jgi:hypothetical protein
MITREWLEGEIKKLERELAGAGPRLAAAARELDRAREKYRAAKETADTTAGVLLGLRDELDFMNSRGGK